MDKLMTDEEDIKLMGFNPLSPNPSLNFWYNKIGFLTTNQGHALERVFDPAHYVDSSVLPLYLKAGASFSSSLNLYLSGKGESYNSGILDLFLCNNYIGGDYLPLFIGGYGTNDGYNYIADSLNLYLERPTSDVLDLTLLGPYYPASGETLPMYLYGSYVMTGSLDLVIGCGWNSLSGSLPLYVNGF